VRTLRRSRPSGSWENTRGTKPAGDNSWKNSPKLNETKRSSICDRRADKGAWPLRALRQGLSKITKAKNPQTDALAKLLIENGIITRQEFLAKISEERATYQAMFKPTPH
jgi:hypothetical protein